MSRSPRTRLRLALALSALVISAHPVRAAVIWNEGADGDLSSVQASPTTVTLGLGTNSVIGTIGGGDSLDWITVHVQPGQTLNSVVLVSYSSTDNQGFTGFQPGAAFQGSVFDPTAYAGYAHFGTAATNGALPATNLVGADLLALMADPAVAPGAQGFAIPLGAGDYAFLIRQTGALTDY